MTFKRKTLWKTRKRKGGNKETVDSYKTTLSSFAYTDAKHDFGSTDFFERYKDTIKDTIPDAPYIIYSEDNLLQSINITHINGEPDTMLFKIENIVNACNTLPMLEIDFLINNIKRSYNVKTVYYQKDKDNIVADPHDFMYYFGGKRTFVFDVFNIKFLSGFKNTEDTSLYNEEEPYYILYNREMKSDPGNKAKLEREHYAHKGYCLKDIYDIDPNIITYNKWNDSNLIYKNMFFSNCNISLENNTDSTIQMTIDSKYSPETFTINKNSNSINELIKEVNENTIVPTIAFLRKRSGDSLQILSTFDNTRVLSDNKAHNYPKMLISLDRLALYNCLLLGVDIGFTVILYDTKHNPYYYLITFLNNDTKYTNTFNYSTNHLGGRQNPKNIKLKQNKTRKIKQKMNADSLEQIYNSIILPEIKQYINNRYTNLIKYEDKIKEAYDELYIKNKKDSIIKYISFYNNTQYDKGYISKLIYEKYVNITPLPSNDDIIYRTNRVSMYFLLYIYKTKYNDDVLNEIVSYYDERDTQFADYLRSLNCILWIIRKYFDLYIEDHTFNNYDRYSMERLMTPEIQKIYDEQTDPKKDKSCRFSDLAEILRETKQFPEYFEQICHTSDWSFVDLTQIIHYIEKNDLEVYPTLKRLAADYYWSMYKIKPSGSGFSDASILVLGDLEYKFDKEVERTPELQKMIDDMNSKKVRHFIKDYREAVDTIIRLFKRTVDKHLTWGLRIF